MKYIVITGGSGYIGSAISKLLLERGFGVINIDQESPGEWTRDEKHYYYIQMQLGSRFGKDPDPTEEVNYLSKGNELFGLIHMAAWKDLPGSYDNPLEYYKNNLGSTIKAAEIAGKLGCKTIIFSSSAGVYADDLTGAVKETDSTNCESPYGYSKLVGEKIIHDVAEQFRMNSFCLRYCNPIGSFRGVSADLSDSMFGNVYHALKEDKEFIIFGGDYDTPDGTCIRDYIDLEDIARAHVHFLRYGDSLLESHDTVNVGTGVGVSCLEVCDHVKSMIPEFKFRIGPRREGDAPGSWADITKLKKQYGFSCEVPLEKSIESIIKLVKNG